MKVAIVLFEGITALDAIGPYEVFNALDDTEILFVADSKGLKRSHTRALALNADYSYDEVDNPDIIIVPGTPFVENVTHDDAMRDWIKQVHPGTRWTTSVCTGALALAAAGLLQDLSATTHWMMLDMLKEFGAIPSKQRVVKEGKIITAAGVSSGIDMALALVALERDEATAQEVQLIIEYDPQPPFDAGSPDKAPQSVKDNLLAKFAHLAS